MYVYRNNGPFPYGSSRSSNVTDGINEVGQATWIAPVALNGLNRPHGDLFE